MNETSAKSEHALELKEIYENKNKKHFEWVKNIVLVASTLLGVLISLHSKKSESLVIHLFFSCTISLLCIGILTSLIYLYAEIDVYNHHINIYEDFLEGKHKHKYENDKYGKRRVIYAGIKSIYVYMKVVAFFSLSFSLISLVIYSILLDT